MYWWNVLYFFASAFTLGALAYLWSPGKLGRSLEDTFNFVIAYLLVILALWGVALGVLGAGWITSSIGLCR
jgi:hypothetical protein